MKISFNWLKEFIPLKISPKELSEKINMSTVEVEEIIDYEKIFKNIFVGEVKEIKKHPKAERLSVAKFSIGKKTVQIVFGGLKIKVGDKLPMVLAPAVLPTGLEVGKKLFHGVESHGMITSNKELGLDYPGEVIFFEKNIKAGTPLAKALGIDDTVLNLDVLSNRGDLFSHLGVAREIGAILGKKIKVVEVKIKESAKKTEDCLEVEIKDKALCPRYEARVIQNIKIEESPAWLKNRLIVLGIRPVNNVVDVTNYVMMELGQPLHAFDFNKLTGGNKKKIIIRKAKTGEEITTLDEKERRLTKDVLVIADSKNPIAIAGIMGGKYSEVDSETKNIVLESANFNWVSIRKASRILGLRTEAIVRFEKNLDPSFTAKALERASQLISQLAGGEILSGAIDKNYYLNKPKIIKLRLPRVEKILAQKFSAEKIKKILLLLGMDVLFKGDVLEVKVPSFRKDIKEEADLVEEVARISGYDKVPTTLPIAEIFASQKNEEIECENKIKNTLIGLGSTEVTNYTFLGEETLRKFNQNSKGYLKLKNPLKPEHTYLRKNLTFSMTEIAEENAKNFEEFSIFEIARIFLGKDSKLPKEEKKVSVLGYFKKDAFLKTKGILEELFSELGIKNVSFKPYKNGEDFWHPKRTASIFVDQENIGKIGKLHPGILNRFDFKNKMSVAELDFSALMRKQEIKIFKPFSRYPKIVLDIAITVDERLAEEEIRDAIYKSGKGLIKKVELFDVYRGKQIEVGKKSLAYHITYQSDRKTLTDDEVDSVHQTAVSSLGRKFNAKIRS